MIILSSIAFVCVLAMMLGLYLLARRMTYYRRYYQKTGDDDYSTPKKRFKTVIVSVLAETAAVAILLTMVVLGMLGAIDVFFGFDL